MFAGENVDGRVDRRKDRSMTPPLLTHDEIEMLLVVPAAAPRQEKVSLVSVDIAVLAVDDDSEAVQEIVECVSDLGMTCFGACDASRALEFVENEPSVGIVITDLRMPGLNGIEFAHRLGRIPGRDIQCIMVSGHGVMKDVQRAMHENISDFLTKPLNLDDLAAALERATNLTDMAMGRVVEDLIEALIDKNVIMLTDLPAPAQRKVMARRELRGRSSDLADLVDDGDGDPWRDERLGARTPGPAQRTT